MEASDPAIPRRRRRKTPGSERRSRAERPSRHLSLLGADVTEKTAICYAREFQLFEVFYRYRGLEIVDVLRDDGAAAVIALAGKYLNE